MKNTDDLRITGTKELLAPEQLLELFPITEQAAETTAQARQEIEAIMSGDDDRLVVIVGPCSIHDPKSAMEYAAGLKAVKDELAADLQIIMRVYFEKPRTTVGWKGLINDPDLDGSYNINKGLGVARNLLLDINNLGLPAGCEYLDLITPQYSGDLVSWGAIGARTTESQCHRELASGLSCPVGFKNGTNGNVKIAVDAIGAAKNSHHFLSVTKEGRTAIFTSAGNAYCHVILRGGSAEPNYSAEHVESTSAMVEKADLKANIMIDFSHANSHKDPARQVEVAENVAGQISSGDQRIFGVMIESHLVHGNQKVVEGQDLVYGQSITDGCLGWDDTQLMLRKLAAAVRDRRAKQQAA
ncbi:MAG: 3-deoxy-7-phosphoheptulonate synthase [Arenicella sp.]